MGFFEFEKTETEKINERLDELEKLIKKIQSRVNSVHPLHDKRPYGPIKSPYVWPPKKHRFIKCTSRCGTTSCTCYIQDLYF